MKALMTGRRVTTLFISHIYTVCHWQQISNITDRIASRNQVCSDLATEMVLVLIALPIHGQSVW